MEWIREYWDRTPDLKDWFNWENYYDCFSAVINSANVDSYRANFGIEDDEDILFARDTSRFDSRNQGLVITDLGLNVIRNNSDGEREYIGWFMFHYVKVEDDQLYFYDKDGEYVSNLWQNFFFKNYCTDYRLTKLAKYLEKIARRASEQMELFDLIDKEEYSEALDKINHILEEWNDEGGLHYQKGEIYYYMSQSSTDEKYNNKMEEEYKKAISLLSDDNPLKSECFLALAMINENENIWVARNYYLLAMENPITDVTKIKYMLDDLETESKEEMEHYIDYEYKSRKLLMPIDDHRIAGCVAGGIDVFRMSNIPSCIKFPVGHPVSGQLYIGHPFKPELYVPYETYEETFFVDKVHELCHLLQCLGATEITIESVKGRNVSELYNDSLSVNGDVGIKAFSGSGSYDSNYSSDRGETSHSKRAMHFTFDPMYKPYVPEGLVWYPESTEWQRLVQNRLHGNMLEYSEHLSTSQTRIVNSAEQEKVKASARILWAKANVNVEKSSNNSFKESIETEWKVSVTFRSIREMNGCDEHQSDNEYDSNDLDIESLMDVAEQGDAVAQYNLGVCYRDGKGIQQDYIKAFDWFKKSAEQGYATAQFEIGFCYRTGKGIQQDYKKAFEWFKKSAEQGYATAQFCLGLCYSYGRGVQENYKKAFEWFEKSVEQGIFLAQRELGILYAQGLGVKQDDSKAVELYRKAAEQGDSVALNNLGYMYEHGRGVPQSYEEAFKLYSKAAKGKGNVSKSIWHLGDFYENGKGVQKDYNKALDLYKQALDKGYEEAQKDIDRVTAILNNGGNTTSSATNSGNEQEYIDTLKEIIAEDGEITDRERRLLEKLRTKLGISESRAKELEDALANPSLTAEEQEYLDEYKSIAADGEITDKERKLLNKIRKMSGISEERAIEIEKMA
ncbi:MAG: SEL1-like repeat protein [Bacteroidales bacterium]|nr:SEL1-like repeat protein [Bacteroidales bacterium]